ncbi:LacI family DNA-binding transcriptional regulator [Phototrophicus methaneseepsis]|uniref:LacI family DNA-binding transcriptional regulator n=1 Tax=Phototrophicus methaneseepsis TaxID=2710758 RepID=A0A7S8IGE6_9CHLR|nr:LacI family DNA-binding transcriptional regulator [Phototrophicus methaneseepsis]QPC84676.1 LacI family DNA-binding transcriptional regulator [Phototrophicus methaneseepsis]
MKRPTQADVAQLAGVSVATVSYVLNDPTGQKVPISPETRQRVQNAIAELGYIPNLRAQSLRSGSTRTIGVLLPIDQNSYFWQILMGISNEAESHDFSVLLLPDSGLQPAPQTKHRLIQALAQQRVDGIILMLNSIALPASIVDQLHKSSEPIVQITSYESEFDYVFGTYDDGTEELMHHLLQLGHRRIGFIHGVVESSLGSDRLQVYEQIVAEANLPYDQDYIQRCGPTSEDAYHATLNLLRRPDRPTALLVINDLLAIAAMRAAADLGLRIPDDVSIAGFDGVPSSNYSIPRLTTVSSNPTEQGRLAMRLMLKRLENPELPQQIIKPGAKLIIQESTGPVPYT